MSLGGTRRTVSPAASRSRSNRRVRWRQSSSAQVRSRQRRAQRISSRWPAGLVDAARPGAPRRILAEDVERVLNHLRLPPPAGTQRWTTRSLARTCHVSQTTVSRIWRAHGVDPRSGAMPPRARSDGDGGSAQPPTVGVAASVADDRATELARLAREVSELRTVAPPEEAPFLRVALEAIEGALSSSNLPRLHAAREGSTVQSKAPERIPFARRCVDRHPSLEARIQAGGRERLRRDPPHGSDRGGAAT